LLVAVERRQNLNRDSTLAAMPQAEPRRMNLLRHGRSPHLPLASASGRGQVGAPRV